ncbi:HtaA domain-containing protein [Streptomyces sp. LP11]|uniref:HtaA domain-containing protein n=1 Tax=Streptomyces pyxinicus TaxID=2970331 RepID=A0ABT2B9Y2_9ACTN|nr:HtaA domain-containing protein [Streptomyces sp. LP11]MCS0605255.1 HtaA domain-containing protein [Streptomyces sp. LP11]
MPATAPRRLALAAAAVAVTLGSGALTALTATTASAADIPLTGYQLTWGIKQSYRSYVTGFAQGTFTATGGASQAANNGAFTFTDGKGSYDSAKHTVHLAFQGTLTIESKLHGFKREISDVQYDSATGALTADLVADGGAKQQDVPLAKVAAPTSQDMTNLGTTLTTQAGDFLGSSSYAGAAGDPVSVVPPKQTPDPTPTKTATPTPTGTATAKPTATATAKPTKSPSKSPSPTASTAPTMGSIVDGTLGWGVKKSFRTYVVGGVAHGKISTSGGAKQASGNGAFTFPGATGSYDTKADSLAAAVKGAVNFKGHETNGTYGLDLTLSDLHATLKRGTGKLTADVTSLGKKSQDVVLADLKAKSTDLTAKKNVITVNGVTATLTDAGAKAFSGYYPKGTVLDPVNLSVAVKKGATLPTGTGGTTTTTATGTGAGTTGAGTTGTGSTTGGGGVVGGTMAATGSDTPVGALGAAAAVTVAAGAGVVVAVRRRRPAHAEA